MRQVTVYLGTIACRLYAILQCLRAESVSVLYIQAVSLRDYSASASIVITSTTILMMSIRPWVITDSYSHRQLAVTNSSDASALNIPHAYLAHLHTSWYILF